MKILSLSSTMTDTVTDFEMWFTKTKGTIVDKALAIVFAFMVFFLGKWLIKKLVKLIDHSMERAGVEVTVRKFLKYLLKAVGYLLLVGIICAIVGYDGASLMTVMGSVGIALGLALQGSLSNFAGGVLILLLRPFKVGDYIKEDNKGNEGTVKSIGLVYTELVTPDNRLIVIPNGTLANSSLTNVTAQDKRRINDTVGIGYQADLKKAKALIMQIMKARPNVLQEEGLEPLVYVSELADSAVVLGYRFWTEKDNYWTEKWAVMEEIKLTFDAEGIEIPFNQLDVHVRTEETK